MKRIAAVRDADNAVTGVWMGGDEQTLSAVSGRTYVSLSEGAPDPIGLKWVSGETFETFPTAPIRNISRLAFLHRFTLDEHTAIEALLHIRPRARAWMERLTDGVYLDDANILNGLNWIKQQSLDLVNTPAEARVWPDAATADTRIAAVLS